MAVSPRPSESARGLAHGAFAPIERLSGRPRTRDLARLAELHACCLGDSILTQIGPRFVAAYYSFIAGSSDESLLVCRSDTEIVGLVVLSRKPASVIGRLLRSPRPTGLFFLALVRSPSLVVRLAQEMLSKPPREHRSAHPAQAAAEVLQLCTNPDCRGQGVASRLLAAVEAELLRDQEHSYTVHTQAVENDAAIHFYVNRGFRRAAEEIHWGEPYLRMEKTLVRQPQAA